MWKNVLSSSGEALLGAQRFLSFRYYAIWGWELGWRMRPRSLHEGVSLLCGYDTGGKMARGRFASTSIPWTLPGFKKCGINRFLIDRVVEFSLGVHRRPQLCLRSSNASWDSSGKPLITLCAHVSSKNGIARSCRANWLKYNRRILPKTGKNRFLGN